MNLMFSNIINGVVALKIENDLLFFQDKNYELKSDIWEVPTSMYECFYVSGKWFFNGLDNSLYVLQNETIKKITEAKPITFIDKKNQKALLSFDTFGHSYKRTIFDLIRLEDCLETPDYLEITINILENNILYYCDKRQYLLKAINLVTKENLWTNNISDIGIWRRYGHGVTYREDYTIKRAIAVVNDVLWLDISKGVIMGIDTQTGKTLHVFKEQAAEIIKIEGKNTQTQEYVFDQKVDLPEQPNTFYDKETQKLFGVHNHQYYEVDLQNPTLRIWDLIDEYALFGDIHPFNNGTSIVGLQAWATRSCFDAEYIYFIANNPSKEQIVALNRQTLKIDLFYELEDSGHLMQIEVSSGKLYVLDHKNILYIFEREEKEI